MITLAIDSTANTASCALLKDGRMAALYTVNGLLTHSETLLPMIENALSKLSLKIEDIDLFSVCDGPGSFTGVRIGVSLIKGLAFGRNKPCVGISTLAALAKNLDGVSGYVVPVMDARRSQVYTAIFKDGKRITEDMLIPLEELYEMIKNMGISSIRLCGDGYDIAREFFREKDVLVHDTPALMIPQNALSCALLAEKAYNDGKITTDKGLSAKYLRASQAEREREERLKGQG